MMQMGGCGNLYGMRVELKAMLLTSLIVQFCSEDFSLSPKRSRRVKNESQYNISHLKVKRNLPCEPPHFHHQKLRSCAPDKFARYNFF